MWYVLQVVKYAKKYGADDDLVVRSKDNVLGVLGYFAGKENELGLLENLESWVFVEWSAANDRSHIEGVNVPSNICYAACLDEVGKLYARADFCEKAAKIRKEIKELAFNGEFFVDNLVRDEDGDLKQTGYLTEVCQYYAFWFGCAGTKEYPALFEELIERLGTNRTEGYRPDIEIPNVMYGLYMRIDLLMREGRRKEVLDECIRLFGKMAERTGTLWENNAICASCDHGFASYAARWIVYALTGYDSIAGGAPADEGIGVDCDITLPLDGKGKKMRIVVKDNRVKTYYPLVVYSLKNE
jgi:alpha-L-rhamnosidase